METIDDFENDQYTTIHGISRAELNIKKSRFISLAASVSSEQEAMEFIQKVKLDFPGATHYCYASIIGVGVKRLVRSSDAGEPANSAGKPILRAIESSNLQNLICVVVRYFGGIKLGIGGLIRAYGQSARDCLKNAQTETRILSVILQIEIPHNHIGIFVNLISRIKGKILSMNHGEKVRALVQIRGKMAPILRESMKAISDDIVFLNISSEGLK